MYFSCPRISAISLPLSVVSISARLSASAAIRSPSFRRSRAARRCVQFAPVAIEGRACRGHRAIDIGRIAARDQSPRRRRKRIDRFKPLAGLRVDPFARDEQLMLLHP
jgi:hypothetical protein